MCGLVCSDWIAEINIVDTIRRCMTLYPYDWHRSYIECWIGTWRKRSRCSPCWPSIRGERVVYTVIMKDHMDCVTYPVSTDSNFMAVAERGGSLRIDRSHIVVILLCLNKDTAGHDTDNKFSDCHFHLH